MNPFQPILLGAEFGPLNSKNRLLATSFLPIMRGSSLSRYARSFLSITFERVSLPSSSARCQCEGRDMPRRRLTRSLFTGDKRGNLIICSALVMRTQPPELPRKQ